MSAQPNDPVPPADWVRETDEVFATCRVFDLRKRHFRHPSNGSSGDFFVINSRDWVNVVPVTDDGRIVLVRQYRFGIEGLSWEVPGGIIEKGEEPVVAGLRELGEETGWYAGKGQLIGHCRPNPAIMNNTCHVVLASNMEFRGITDWDEHEEIEVRAFPEETVFEMIANFEIHHSLAINALFYYRMHKASPK